MDALDQWILNLPPWPAAIVVIALFALIGWIVYCMTK